MAGNDWNNLGREVKDIVQHAIDTGDFGALNRDLGVTLENALGNVAQSLKNAGRRGMGNFGIILKIQEDPTDRETATAQNTVTVLLGAAAPMTDTTVLQRE